jgi:hypothetical protein
MCLDTVHLNLNLKLNLNLNLNLNPVNRAVPHVSGHRVLVREKGRKQLQKV